MFASVVLEIDIELMKKNDDTKEKSPEFMTYTDY